MLAPSSWIWAIVVAPFIGSFLGVLITRASAPRTILWTRSVCDACGHTLGPVDLVPLASWAGAAGRCRYCRTRIGWFYPGIELAAFAVAGWSALLASGWLVWASCGLGWALLALAAIDWREFRLPDFLTLPLIAAGVFVSGLADATSLLNSVVGAAAGYLFVVVVRWIYQRIRGREGMGLGDAKLLAAGGAWVSWIGLPSVVLIAAVAALAVTFIRTRGTKLRSDEHVPFGAYLSVGIWLVWLYGPLLV